MTLSEIRQLDDSIAHLIPRAQRGELAALDELIRRCYRLIYRWAASTTDDLDEADEVTQEVLVRLHRKLGTFRGGSRFTTWLYRVTRNTSMEMHRRGSRHRHAELDEAQDESTNPDVDRRLDRSRAVAAVRRAFDALPAGQRHVFDLADLQGFTPKEIGEMLDMKPVTVRAHLAKARRAIRKRMLERNPTLVRDVIS